MFVTSDRPVSYSLTAFDMHADTENKAQKRNKKKCRKHEEAKRLCNFVCFGIFINYNLCRSIQKVARTLYASCVIFLALCCKFNEVLICHFWLAAPDAERWRRTGSWITRGSRALTSLSFSRAGTSSLSFLELISYPLGLLCPVVVVCHVI